MYIFFYFQFDDTSLKILSELLKNNCNTSFRSFDGKTPIEEAQSNVNLFIIFRVIKKQFIYYLIKVALRDGKELLLQKKKPKYF